MSPQPISKTKDVDAWIMYSDVLSEKPEQAAMIMRVIAIWSFIDCELSAILCHFMNADLIIGTTMFDNLRSATNRLTILRQVSNIALSGDDEGKDLVSQVASIADGVRKTRDAFAHRIWVATSPKDALALVPPSQLSLRRAYDREHAIGPDRANTKEKWSAAIAPQKEEMVYTNEDLARELRDALKASHLVYLLRACFDDELSIRSRARLEIRRELGEFRIPGT